MNQPNLVQRLQTVIDSMRKSSFGEGGRGVDPEFQARVIKSVDEIVLQPFYAALSNAGEMKVDASSPVRSEGKVNEHNVRYDCIKTDAVYALSDALTIREEITEQGYFFVNKGTWNPSSKSQRYTFQIKDSNGRVTEQISGGTIVSEWERFQYTEEGALQQYAKIDFRGIFSSGAVTQMKYGNGNPVEGMNIEFFPARKSDDSSGKTTIRLVKKTANPEQWGCAAYQNPTSGLEYLTLFSAERETAPLQQVGLSDVAPSKETDYTLGDSKDEMMYVWTTVDSVLIGDTWVPKCSDSRSVDATVKFPGKKLRCGYTRWARPGLGKSDVGYEPLPAILTRVDDATFEIEFPDNATVRFPREIKIREYQRELAKEVLYN